MRCNQIKSETRRPLAKPMELWPIVGLAGWGGAPYVLFSGRDSGAIYPLQTERTYGLSHGQPPEHAGL